MNHPATLAHPLRPIREIGRGAFSVVWEAHDLVLDRPVAAKFFLGRDTPGDVRSITAFSDEVAALVAVDHPHIVEVIDYGLTAPPRNTDQPRRAPCITMELAAGTLVDRSPPAAWDDVVDLVRPLLRALAHLHARDIIHRDIKPSNVLVAHDGRIKLADFSIVHHADRGTRSGASHHTAGTSERPLGTRRYSPLEQRLGKWRDYGPWTDLYALGVLVAELVGQPCDDDHPRRLPLSREIPSLRPRMAVPESLAAWLAGLTHPAPARRYRRAAANLRDLDAMPPPPEAHPTLPGLGSRRLRIGPDDDGTEPHDVPLEPGDLSPVAHAPARGWSLRPAPLVERRSALERIVRAAWTEAPRVIRYGGADGAGHRRFAAEAVASLRAGDPRAALLIDVDDSGPLQSAHRAIARWARAEGLTDPERIARRARHALGARSGPHVDVLARALAATTPTLDDVADAVGALADSGVRCLAIDDPAPELVAAWAARRAPAVLVVAPCDAPDVALEPLTPDAVATALAALDPFPAPVIAALCAGPMAPADLSVRAWLARAALDAGGSSDDAARAAGAEPTTRVDAIRASLPLITLARLERLAALGHHVRRGAAFDDPATAAIDLQPALRAHILRRTAVGWAFSSRALRRQLVPTGAG